MNRVLNYLKNIKFNPLVNRPITINNKQKYNKHKNSPFRIQKRQLSTYPPNKNNNIYLYIIISVLIMSHL